MLNICFDTPLTPSKHQLHFCRKFLCRGNCDFNATAINLRLFSCVRSLYHCIALLSMNLQPRAGHVGFRGTVRYASMNAHVNRVRTLLLDVAWIFTISGRTTL